MYRLIIHSQSLACINAESFCRKIWGNKIAMGNQRFECLHNFSFFPVGKWFTHYWGVNTSQIQTRGPFHASNLRLSKENARRRDITSSRDDSKRTEILHSFRTGAFSRQARISVPPTRISTAILRLFPALQKRSLWKINSNKILINVLFNLSIKSSFACTEYQ